MRPAKLLCALAQTTKTNDAAVLLQMLPQFFSQLRKKCELTTSAALSSQSAQVGFAHQRVAATFAAALVELEAMQHFIQRSRKLSHRNRLVSQFVLEVMKDR